MRHLILFLSLLLANAAAADSLDIARQLAQGGAPQLALARIVRDQPEPADLQPWWQWEVLRLALLDELGKNTELLDRLQRLPAPPADVMSRIGLYAARAALKAGLGTQARSHLARLLWQVELPAAQAKEVRRLVAQSYVIERRVDEAYRVMLRYAQDFAPLSAEDAAVFTEGLLAAGARAEAGTWLTMLDEGSPLALMARLRSGLLAPEQAIAEARAALNPAAPPGSVKGGGKKMAASLPAAKPSNPAGYWAVIHQAAAQREDAALQAEAREQWLNLANSAEGGLFAMAADDLWRAYFEYARRSGNDAHLLLGEDAAWLELADGLKDRTPPQARALFAYLAAQATELELRERARDSLAASLLSANLARTAVQLFADSPRFAADKALPAAISAAGGQRETLTALGELAEKRGDAAQAADFYLQAAARSGDEPAYRLRFQAVRMLERAGLAEDARRQSLLLTGGRAQPR